MPQKEVTKGNVILSRAKEPVKKNHLIEKGIFIDWTLRYLRVTKRKEAMGKVVNRKKSNITGKEGLLFLHTYSITTTKSVANSEFASGLNYHSQSAKRSP